MAKRRQLWIKHALGKKGRKGALRERLVEVHAMAKSAERIPADALRRAAAGAFGPVTARRARLAKTLRKLR